MFEKWKEILLGSEDEQNSTQSLEHNAHAWSVLFCLQRSLFCLQHSLFCLQRSLFCLQRSLFCLKRSLFCLQHFFVSTFIFLFAACFSFAMFTFFLCSDCFFFAAFLFLCNDFLVGHRTIPMIWPSKLFNESHLNTPELIYPRSELWKLTISQFFSRGLSHV